MEVNRGLVRVLVVEDEVMVALRIHRDLEKAGYHVLPMATNAEEALEAVSEQPPDVVIMDIRLSDNDDGIELAQTLWERYHMPLIFMSGYTDPDTLKRIRHFPKTGFLEKPVRFAQIDTTIYAVLKNPG